MSFVSDSDERSWPTRPAECHVDPCVSWYCSTSTESVQPSFARWYRTEQPMTPPPMTTALARSGTTAASIPCARGLIWVVRACGDAPDQAIRPAPAQDIVVL